MIFLFIIVGLFVGGVLGGAPGGLVGAVIGYLFAAQLSMQEQLAELKKNLAPQGGKETREAEPVQEEAKSPAKSIPAEPVPEIPEAASPVSVPARVVEQETGVIPEKIESPETAKDSSSPFFNPVKAFFAGGNTAVRIGVIVLFFGIAFLLKYAIDHNKLPIEYRLIGTSIGAIVMLILGWRLRGTRRGYALTMQGGAVGILYLVVFAALRLYHLLPPTAAFALLVAIVAFSAVLAVLQNSMAFAIFGVVGGFLAPILTSTGAGNHVMLFSYYSVLNLGILAIAWFKSWRILNLVGFGFTFIIASLWGYRSYTPEHFATTEPFLIFFICLYVMIAVLFAGRQKPELAGFVDGPIVFGTPVIGFGLQSQLVSQYEYGLAWSALTFGIFYLGLASLLWSRHASNRKTLVQSFLAIGVLFGTLVIPLAFDGRWTSAAWAFEGAAAIWIGIKQKHQIPRIFGILLLLGSSLAFLSDIQAPVGLLPILNSFFIGCLVISFAALFSAYQYHLNKADVAAEESSAAHSLLLILGMVWWFVAGIDEISEFVLNKYKINSLLVHVTASVLATWFIAQRLKWEPVNYMAYGLLPAMVAAAAGMYISVAHPMANGGYVSWAFAFVVYYGLLKKKEPGLQQNFLRYGHAIGFWLILFLAGWQAHWSVSKLEGLSPVWLQITLALVPALFIYGVTQISLRPGAWPVGSHKETYLGLATIPVLVLLWLGAVIVSVSNSGDVRPLPYIPLLNPLDLTQMLVFVTAINWFIKAKPFGFGILDKKNIPNLYGLAALTVFLWLNAVLIRTIHHWVGTPFRFRDMFSSVLVQTSLSIFWGVLGLIIMSVATRYRKRIAWYSGAGLLAVVVAKLFLVDLAQSGTIERIVSFIVVGVLLLVVGYFTPMPPKTSAKEEEV